MFEVLTNILPSEEDFAVRPIGEMSWFLNMSGAA